MSTLQPPDSVFARGIYTITKVIGGSPKDGELEVYVLYKGNVGRPTSELEEMLWNGQHPGKLVAKFKEGLGITVLDEQIYEAWSGRIRTELERLRDSKTGAARLLTMYVLDEMLNPTSAELHSPQPRPASHRE